MPRTYLPSHGLLRVLMAGALLPDVTCAVAATFNVNTTADVPNANPSIGLCETATGNGVCSLRAAIQAANALPGADTIVLQSNAIYQLTRPGVDDTALNGDLDILDNVTLTGAGPGSTIIDGNGAVTGERVFQIFRCIGNVTVNGSCTFGSVVAEISGVTIQHGSSPNTGGGGILNAGTLTLANCNIANNTGNGAPADGGGIHNEGVLTLTNSTVFNNATAAVNSQGGGIWTSGQLTIAGSTIIGNTTLGRGGGIFIGLGSGGNKISGSTISGNMGQRGGGIYNSGYLVAINSTISGNDSSISGGGIAAGGTRTTALFNVTVAGNVANFFGNSGGVGGGVEGGGLGVLTFKNSIIALNGHIMKVGQSNFLINDDCDGQITSQGNSIMFAVDSSHCTANGAPMIADPGIGPLQDNGGPTQTHALLSASPAIDGVVIGDCTDDLGAILATDQRGLQRPTGARCDIGAFELDTIFRNGFEP